MLEKCERIRLIPRDCLHDIPMLFDTRPIQTVSIHNSYGSPTWIDTAVHNAKALSKQDSRWDDGISVRIPDGS